MKNRRKSILTVDLLREIKRSFERFLSIFAIVAIGVAFFAGIKATSSVMKASADAYYDKYNLMDLRIVSNFGLTDDDLLAINKVDGVKASYATSTMTVLTSKDNDEYVMIIHGIDMDKANNNEDDYINQYALIDGRLPQRSGECLIEDNKMYQSDLQLNDIITISTGTDSDIRDSLKTAEYKIVGIVRTPYYLSYEKGSTNIKDGRIDSFLIIPNSDFINEYYTEIFVTIDQAKALNSYSDEYFDHIASTVDRLTSVGISQSEKRYEEIIVEATAKLDEAKQEYQDGVNTYEDEIEKAERQLEDARFELVKGQIELSNNKLMLQITLQSYQSDIDSAKQAVVIATQSYDQLNDQLAITRPQVDALIAGYQIELEAVNLQIAAKQLQITNVQAQIDDNNEEIATLQALRATYDVSSPEYTSITQQINDLETENIVLQAELNTYQSEVTSLNNQKRQLETNIDLANLSISTLNQQLISLQETIVAYQTQITEGEKEIAIAKQTADIEFAKAQTKIDNGQKEIVNGQLELEKQKIEGQEKLDDAYELIIKAEKDIEEIEEAQWYILDRNSHYSYRDYGSAADRMDSIAQVFPVFFFLVAALVCSTTMTRMIDEQRGSIGTLKALGYNNLAIVGKYLKYSFLACLAGCVFGIVAGMYIFPTVIFEVWNTMYTVPDIVYLANLPLVVLTSLIAILTTMVASFSSCYVILKDKPATLLRPKAPVIGKVIMMERINFLWKRMSFTAKVTARNIFRYKKRFFMTVIGISGCSALLLAGFGIRDSIGQIAVYQFEEIISYSASAKFDDDLTMLEKETFISEIKSDNNVLDAMIISESSGKIYIANEELAVSIIAPYDIEQFKSFYSLRDRQSKEAIFIKTNGIVISEKAANDLDLKIDDKVTISNSDGYKEQATITAITENYVGHYVFISPAHYKELFNLRPEYNTSIIRLLDTSKKVESDFGTKLIDSGDITSITFYSGLADQFIDMIGSLNLVVVVMIISAGILAFVVLYNLSNVNISERMREIATIKVLGFNQKEVSNYVYREIAILTFVGSLLGLVLGRALHLFIMKIAELESVMFGREIYPLSYIYSIIITLVFSLIVNIAMNKKLKNIKMVESLKSVE